MKRSEQIVELMDDVKKIISQMAVVDVREKEKKPVEVGKTIMTSPGRWRICSRNTTRLHIAE